MDFFRGEIGIVSVFATCANVTGMDNLLFFGKLRFSRFGDAECC